MEKMLVASDFDGTIGATPQRLKRDLSAIAAFRAKGHFFGLVSGRNAAGLLQMQRQYGLPCDFLMSDNGGVCYLQDRLLFAREADEALYLPLADFLLENGSDMLAVNKSDGVDLLFFREKEGGITTCIPRNLWQIRPFTQMSGIFGDSRRCLQMAKRAQVRFPKIKALVSDDCLDLVPRGTDKATGISFLASHLQIPRGRVYTVGDNYNDLDMLEAFSGFAVENACDEVKRRARGGVVESVGALLEALLEGEKKD